MYYLCLALLAIYLYPMFVMFPDNMPHTLWIWDIQKLALCAVLIQSAPIRRKYILYTNQIC
jgi:hypothetical protein